LEKLSVWADPIKMPVNGNAAVKRVQAPVLLIDNDNVLDVAEVP
jgi:hypothetical protein